MANPKGQLKITKKQKYLEQIKFFRPQNASFIIRRIPQVIYQGKRDGWGYIQQNWKDVLHLNCFNGHLQIGPAQNIQNKC